VAFTYGGTGERLKKVSGSQVTRYVGGNYEIAPNGTVTKYLIGGKQVGTAFFINHSDHLGSIQAVTDASGAEVRRQDHTPFGDQHYAAGSHAESKGWIGEREEETELVYLNARYYDPEIGRFTAPDPIVLPGQLLNRYSYAVNNSINLLDPTGLLPIDPELDHTLPPGTIDGNPPYTPPAPERKRTPNPTPTGNPGAPPTPTPPTTPAPVPTTGDVTGEPPPPDEDFFGKKPVPTDKDYWERIDRWCNFFPNDPDCPGSPNGNVPSTLDAKDCLLIAGAPDCPEINGQPPPATEHPPFPTPRNAVPRSPLTVPPPPPPLPPVPKSSRSEGSN
jgi:RHS repeat-associated protein